MAAWMRAGSVKHFVKNKNQKIFCSVAVKIKIVCERYATDWPIARPYPLPLQLKPSRS
jgi:hypothetical protein